MRIYLHDIPLVHAQEIILTTLKEMGIDSLLGFEELPISEVLLGRITSEPVWALMSSPHYHSSAMDGFAVRAEGTISATPSKPLTLDFGKDAAYLDTGDALPEWADAVIPIEDVEPLDGDSAAGNPRKPQKIQIRSSIPPWKNVRPMGEDMVASQLILTSGHTIRPVDLGAAAGSGNTHIKVAKKPRVAILPTGTELRPVGLPVKPGEIIEYNSIVLAAQISAWGGDPIRFSPVPDDPAIILERLLQAAKNSDLILINAGSSAGQEDYSEKIIASVGKVLFHGVAVRPGHPVIFGLITQGVNRPVPVFGVPGFPVSAALTSEIFIQPLIERWLGKNPVPATTLAAKITRKVTSPAGDDDYLRVVVGKVGEDILATPLMRGAGVISSLVRADGIVVIPAGIQGLEAGSRVHVNFYHKPEVIENTILTIGSHDITLDLLAEYLAPFNRRLVSANVGSLGGLIALSRGDSHFSGSHLLDAETGEYNRSYIAKYVRTPVSVFGFIDRVQGLMVKKGNPKRINTLEDIARPGIKFINRQRGSGTRVLLDYYLSKMEIDITKIQGYRQEEYTHLAVAAAIQSGRTDCGLGIAAAAKALDLGFIPLYVEQYDLVIAQSYFDSHLLAPLFDLLSSDKFSNAIRALPGYQVPNIGRLLFSQNEEKNVTG